VFLDRSDPTETETALIGLEAKLSLLVAPRRLDSIVTAEEEEGQGQEPYHESQRAVLRRRLVRLCCGTDRTDSEGGRARDASLSDAQVPPRLRAMITEFVRTVDTPIGSFSISSDGTSITRLQFGRHPESDGSCSVLGTGVAELNEYYAGRSTNLTSPIAPGETGFQNDVWGAVRTIPYGHTSTYSEIAKSIGRPKAVRAVDAANGANPIPPIIPCHRIIGASGDLEGYVGGLDTKTGSLRLEGSLLL
jgi:methylated-DNA-[protein]-cysteine S-methyltransferase